MALLSSYLPHPLPQSPLFSLGGPPLIISPSPSPSSSHLPHASLILTFLLLELPHAALLLTLVLKLPSSRSVALVSSYLPHPVPIQISNAIRDGAEGFLITHGTISKMAILLAFVILGIYLIRNSSPQQEASELASLWCRTTSSHVTVLAFMFGALCLGIRRYIGMWVSVQANVRVATTAR